MKVYDRLTMVMNMLKDIRDTQEEIKCNKDESCICDQFDLIIDEVESLRDKFGNDNRKRCFDDCYFYVDMSGVYEGRSYCRLGYRVNTEGECGKYIHRKNEKGILHYKITQQMKRVDENNIKQQKELAYLNKLLKQLKRVT